MYQLERLSMTSPWSITTGGRRMPSAPRRSTCVLNRSPLAITSGIVGAAFGGDDDVVDEVADGHGEDLVELLVREPADEVDALAVALQQLLGQSHELDALDLELVVEGSLGGDLDIEEVLLADHLDEELPHLFQDVRGLNRRSRQRRTPSLRP